MPPDQRDDVHAKGRRYGHRDGAFYAAMQGGGENYLSAFALLLQATPFQIGLLSALPQLVGTWVQLLSVKVLNRLPGRRAVMLGGGAGQAFMWLPLLALPLLFPRYGSWILIACTVLYFAMGHFMIPAWNSLLTGLVDPYARGSYFAQRARIMALANFSALCLAGLILQSAQSAGRSWMGFAVIFVLAACARTVSTMAMARIDESRALQAREADLRLWDFLRHAHSVNFKRFILFSGLMHLCVLMAGPYFVVYMLRDLRFSYVEYGAWLAAGVLAQFATLKPWGRISDRYGNKKVLVMTGLLVPVLPMLYLISTNLVFLVAVNFLGGVIWAGLALGLQNYVFDAVPAENRAKGIAIWNAFNAAGWFCGALLGGWLATVTPSAIALPGLELRFASNLPVVFFLSGVLRLVVSLSLLRTFGETRQVETISHRDLLVELPLVKPLSDMLGRRSHGEGA